MARGLDARAIARELGVGSLLTGTVQRAADQVRINVSLVSATDGAVRWTEKDDRPLTNVFAVQDEIAHALEELGDHDQAIALLGAAVTEHDAWLLQHTRGERYDKLRRDPRGAALLAKTEAW